MDRASDSGSEGWGFESLPVYQIKEEIPFGISSFILRCAQEGTRKDGTSAHTGAKIESWRAIFSPWESPSYFRRIRYGCGWNRNFTSGMPQTGYFDKVAVLIFALK